MSAGLRAEPSIPCWYIRVLQRIFKVHYYKSYYIAPSQWGPKNIKWIMTTIRKYDIDIKKIEKLFLKCFCIIWIKNNHIIIKSDYNCQDLLCCVNIFEWIQKDCLIDFWQPWNEKSYWKGIFKKKSHALQLSRL